MEEIPLAIKVPAQPVGPGGGPRPRLWMAIAGLSGLMVLLLGLILGLQRLGLFDSAPVRSLGAAEASDFPPSVVPNTSVRDDANSAPCGDSGGYCSVYVLPHGTKTAQVEDWYAQNMEPGYAFQGLRWLGDNYDKTLGHAWTWCIVKERRTLEIIPSTDDAGTATIDINVRSSQSDGGYTTQC